MASGVRSLIEGAEELQQRARRLVTPEGAMEFIKVELVLYGELMRELGKVHRIFHARVEEEISLAPAVLAAIAALEKFQLKAAEAADVIGPMAEKLEQKRIEALGDRRNAVWDHSANRGYTG